VSTTGGYTWINKLVTLSSEWKTRELRQVMIALARGPEGVNGASLLLNPGELRTVRVAALVCR
jgi:hypothetical protein